jgi:hypothetical protein
VNLSQKKERSPSWAPLWIVPQNKGFWLLGEFGSPVLFPAILGSLGAYGTALAVREGLEPALADSEILQIFLGRASSLVSQGDVVFLGSTIVTVTFDGDHHLAALFQTLGIAVENITVARTQGVAVEIEMDGLERTGRLIHAFTILAHLAFGTIGICLAFALGYAAVILALHSLGAIRVCFAFPLALVILANHPRLATRVAIGVDFALVNAFFVLAERLFLGAIGVLDALDTAHVLALRALCGAIPVLAALLALFVAALEERGIAFLGRAVVIVATLRERRPTANRHDGKNKEYCRSPSQSLGNVAECFHRVTLLAQLPSNA